MGPSVGSPRPSPGSSGPGSSRTVRRVPMRPSRQLLIASVLSTVALDAPATAQSSAVIPGANVNMVSGTQWPDGDPFLQRQNEPSIAVSTRNPLHLLAGAHDYRTVDVPGLPAGKLSG